MRVLYVHSGNLFGGVETLMLTLVQHQRLCPEMEQHFALCFAGKFSDELIDSGKTVHWLGETRVSRPISILRGRKNLGRLLRVGSFDVVITHSCWSQAIFGPVVRAAAVPLVFYLHGPAHNLHWLEWWARRTVPDAALCNSQFTATTLSKSYPRLSGKTVYCPVSPQQQGYSDAQIRQIRADLGTPDDATVLIQVSRMERLKGHRLHLEALSLLKDLPDWVCWQVGGPQRPSEKRYTEELKVTAKRLGIQDRVRFLDQRSDVAALLAAADIYCQPNTKPDSFGITFIEALNAELPVITTALGGAREIIDDTCGLLIPPGDISALADSLRQLIEDQSLRTRLGNAGPARARQLCDPTTQINELHDRLKEMIQVGNAKSNG